MDFDFARPGNSGHDTATRREYEFDTTQKITKTWQKIRHDTDKKMNTTWRHEYLKITWIEGKMCQFL